MLSTFEVHSAYIQGGSLSMLRLRFYPLIVNLINIWFLYFLNIHLKIINFTHFSHFYNFKLIHLCHSKRIKSSGGTHFFLLKTIIFYCKLLSHHTKRRYLFTPNWLTTLLDFDDTSLMLENEIWLINSL